MLNGIFVVMLFYAIGEIISKALGNFIPGSIIGMILLFLALVLKIVDKERVKPIADFLSKNMSLFFVPAGVGIVSMINIFSEFWQAILISSAVSTVLIIVIVALVQEQFEKGKRDE